MSDDEQLDTDRFWFSTAMPLSTQVRGFGTKRRRSRIGAKVQLIRDVYVKGKFDHCEAAIRIPSGKKWVRIPEGSYANQIPAYKYVKQK